MNKKDRKELKLIVDEYAKNKKVDVILNIKEYGDNSHIDYIEEPYGKKTDFKQFHTVPQGQRPWRRPAAWL